jgi:uncharacterized protein (TIGR00369 family)
MTVPAPARPRILEQPTCIACGPEHPHGLRLVFAADANGDQVAHWAATTEWEGFVGLLYGGILATLADEAMAKAVVARGWEAVTGELLVRYHAPVVPGDTLEIRGRVIDQRKRLIRAEATVRKHDGTLCIRAGSTFVVVPGAPIVPSPQ